ncbi:winged helix-turn-helix domain-containing protein [Rhizobium calliandrae]|uniref:Winged helix-turn-helix domain-containing protein n=1 Tax=Rhizobium calliandrae TaxID=1312182 RepID=A0ABT7KR55_9HYPH|nr:winged helix-turn-helix domain-containing protein [Rhizobium calliandrae]MDL2409774.1 winged helix-turn-helix domain-containing protein [Rhizobium calliandrae]
MPPKVATVRAETAFERFETMQKGYARLPSPTILIAAADVSFRWFLEFAIKNRGLAVAGVSTGEALTKRLLIQTPYLLILETRLPGVEAKVLCTSLRRNLRMQSMSIIALAADGDETSGNEILESGANHYISRPFSPETLLASIGSIWPDSNQDRALSHDELLTFLDLELNLAEHRVRRNGRIVHLAPTEFRLLHLLMKAPQRVYSRDEMQRAAWPRAVHLGPRTVDVHIGRLRAALKKAGGADFIRTVRSVGYGLSE